MKKIKNFLASKGMEIEELKEVNKAPESQRGCFFGSTVNIKYYKIVDTEYFIVKKRVGIGTGNEFLYLYRGKELLGNAKVHDTFVKKVLGIFL